MTALLFALCVDAADPARLARFWGGVLGWEGTADLDEGIALVPNDDTGSWSGSGRPGSPRPCPTRCTPT